MLYTDEPIQLKLLRQEQKSQRIKETKELERDYSKRLCDFYRQHEEQKQKQDEYIKVVEDYKRICNEISNLRQTKDDIFKAKEQSELDQERERVLYQQYLAELEQKKKRFDNFMKLKGKEAANDLRQQRENEQKQIEDIYKLQHKQDTKKAYTDKSKAVVNKYKQCEQIKKEKEEQGALENNSLNVLYKLTVPFHNNGNKIDYSTTNFHNVVTIRHQDELNSYMNVNAFDKAKNESDKVKKLREDKAKKIEAFNKNTKQNFRELMAEKRASENLARLQKEINDMTKAKKRTNNSNKVDLNSNMNNAMDLDKKSEYLLNKRLQQAKGNRTKILTNNNNNKDEAPQLVESVADDDSIRQFYGDDQSVHSNNDSYLQRAIDEHNEEIDRQNEMKVNKFYFEEPIARDTKPIKERVYRMNPVDLESYQKAEYDEDVNIVHKEPTVTMANQIRNSLRMTTTLNNSEIGSSTIMENSTFSILDALNISNKGGFDDGNKGKQIVRDFMSRAGQAKAKKASIKNTNLWNIKEEVEGFGWDDEKEKKKGKKKTQGNNNTNNILSNVNLNSSREEKKEDDKEKEKKGQVDGVGEGGDVGKKKEGKDDKDKNKDVNKENKDDKGKEKEKEKDKAKESKDAKWKFSKQELYERKKQMLKDKSNITKKNK